MVAVNFQMGLRRIGYSSSSGKSSSSSSSNISFRQKRLKRLRQAQGSPLDLPPDAPWILFVVGPRDRDMDANMLENMRNGMDSQTMVLYLSSGKSEKPADLKAVVRKIA